MVEGGREIEREGGRGGDERKVCMLYYDTSAACPGGSSMYTTVFNQRIQ